jgi:hypothetical protein
MVDDASDLVEACQNIVEKKVGCFGVPKNFQL